jgi:glutathione S-transferase
VSATRTLWGLRYSPWTEKACWALDHHRVEYRYREHSPLLGEPALRWRTRTRPNGAPATVPVLIEGTEVIGDSTEIARYAERVGSGAPLFGAEREREVLRWCGLSDLAMQFGRALVVSAIARSDAALIESVPPEIPKPLRPAMRGVAKFGTNFIARKYGSDLDARAANEAKLAECCQQILEQLDGRPYLLGSLSYADFACAVVVNGFSPLTERFFPHSPATAKAWTVPTLIDRFGPLVEWRDRLYADHRSSPQPIWH